MAEVLTEQDSVHGQDCVAAGSLVGKLRIEKCRTAEVNYEQEESRADKESLAAGVRIVVTGIAGVHIGAGSHCILAEAAVAGVVALAEFVEVADTAASVGLDVVADVADIDVLGVVGHADTVAQDSFVGVAEPAAQAEIFAMSDTAEWTGVPETVGVDVSGIVGSVDTAGVAGTAGLVRIVEIVDNAGAAVGTADNFAATEWQPSLTAAI